MADDTTTYPHLGFNPVPGVPDHVEALGGKVSQAVGSLAEANRLMGRLRNANDNVWKGDAGDAFRQHVNDKLVTDLDHAHTSLENAVGVLRGWHTDLVGFKDAAAKLDQEAAEAKQQQAQAQTAAEQAKSNPDLGLANQEFPDQASLQQAQGRLNAAESAVREASSAADSADAALDSIMKRAKELESHHDDVASKAADALKDATEHLAPHKPGMFSRLAHAFSDGLKAVGSWVKNHLKDIHSVLSTIAAIGGLVALVTPPPIDAIALGVSVAASAGALACDAADPQFRHGIGQLVHGHFDKQSLGAAMTGVTDLLGVVPGASVAGKALKGTETLAEGASGLSKISDLASMTAHSPGIPAKLISKIPGVSTAVEATKLADRIPSAMALGTKEAINVVWHGKSVASDLYHDAKQAVG